MLMGRNSTESALHFENLVFAIPQVKYNFHKIAPKITQNHVIANPYAPSMVKNKTSQMKRPRREFDTLLKRHSPDARTFPSN